MLALGVKDLLKDLPGAVIQASGECGFVESNLPRLAGPGLGLPTIQIRRPLTGRQVRRLISKFHKACRKAGQVMLLVGQNLVEAFHVIGTILILRCGSETAVEGSLTLFPLAPLPEQIDNALGYGIHGTTHLRLHEEV